MRFSLAVKDGLPENDDLENLAVEIALDGWKLGRQLLGDVSIAREVLFRCLPVPPYDKRAFGMLLEWKEAKGSDATFQVLYDALCHRLVNRRDLARKYCLVN